MVNNNDKTTCSVEQAINASKWDKNTTWEELSKNSECQYSEPDESGVTPAMAAGISDHQWKLEDIVHLLLQKENSN